MSAARRALKRWSRATSRLYTLWMRNWRRPRSIRRATSKVMFLRAATERLSAEMRP